MTIFCVIESDVAATGSPWLLRSLRLALYVINAVVTPLRKAASYEQRKTKFRKVPVTVIYYHVVPRILQH